MASLETVTLAGGCFWCTEAIFKRLKGVHGVTPGYSGGKSKPSYLKVATGLSGHAETIQVEFDPKTISYQKLLEVFFHLHDPTTKNRQGNDVGPQYRSVVFYHSLNQKRIAEKMINKIDRSKTYESPVVTEVVKFESFSPAEDYHQNYYETHQDAQYCRVIIDPKITKLYKDYKNQIKDEYVRI